MPQPPTRRQLGPRLAPARRLRAAERLTRPADARDPEAVARMWEALLRGGPVDAVVANAGVWPSAPLHTGEFGLERWRETLAVNLDGVFLQMQAFFRHLVDVPREEAAAVLV
ncbi:MAG: SDR family NAD(P)-dependent oxidoreductase, partial [Pseudomonadota bacterium]